jgi:hypothetical protein
MLTMSVKPPPGRLKRIAMPRGPDPGLLSALVGNPGALEKRTVTGTAGPLKCAARLSVLACAVGVNVPLVTIPLACMNRKPVWMPPLSCTTTSAICCGRLAAGLALESAGGAAAAAFSAPALERSHPGSTALAPSNAPPASRRDRCSGIRHLA